MTILECPQCHTNFEKSQSEINRSLRLGRPQYCSRVCTGAARSARPQIVHNPNQICALCFKPFYRKPSAQTKHGMYFCCRAHKDQAQRIGGIAAIMPPHYGTSTGLGSAAYRKIAAEHHPLRCINCGWDEVPEILHVHHIDLNRSNNAPDNLEWRCGRCHDLVHFENKTGRWGSWTKSDSN